MQSLKLLAALLVCTVFIFGFSQVGTLVTNQWLPHTNSFSESTLIANAEVSNRSKTDALEKVEAAKNSWLSNGTIYLEWAGELQPFPKEAFTFYIPESVELAEDSSHNPLKVELPNGTLLEQIELLSQTSDIFSAMDTEKLKKDLEEVASHLKEGDHTFSFSDYLVDDEVMDQTNLQITLNIAGQTSISELQEVLNGKEIKLRGNEGFSIETWLENEEMTLSDEAASVLASMLFELIAPTNFSVVERHISKELPTWANEGYEARFQNEKMDFAFTNPNTSEYTITISVNGATITGELNGAPLPFTYEVNQVEMQTLSPKTVIQYSATIPGSGTRVKETGKNGSYVQLVRTATDASGQITETVVYSEDYYAPIQRVELHALTKPVVTTDPTNPNTSGNNNGTNTNPNTNNGTDINTGSNTNIGNTNTNTNTSGTNTNTNNPTGNQNNNTGGTNSNNDTNTDGTNNNNTGSGNGNANDDDNEEPGTGSGYIGK
ncbi:hypothetical protein FZC74_10080 [Sutcliffiella horikoshii]|uniref:G5 domain-containing protein n=1 Tax=Sutcliffiella horikoshii TaxID=79883 RepID=A0AA94WN94_9BACI|nr:VanW family protein [Sutcliffiella horikoshii]TYS59084.1 hypothetical protein FZC74_10080 [Sutcliffiella horikoshii]